LGKDLDKTGMFHADSMNSTYDALIDYKKKLQTVNIRAEDTIVTATEASRVARNAPEFFLKIKNELGFEVKTISGVEEAYFTALGVASGIEKNSMKNCVVMDIGGASTELIKLTLYPFKVESSISLGVGSVRAYDWKNSNIFEESLHKLLAQDLSLYETETIICVAGGMTSLAAMMLNKKYFIESEIDGVEFSAQEFIKFCDLIQIKSTEEINIEFPFLGKRSLVIKSAAEVAKNFILKLLVNKIKISTRGLRFGVVVSEGIQK
jgi:exopolyphosphatase/guanosine-5'-triphosphate,3'-diphosphate pyrophosphatase